MSAAPPPSSAALPRTITPTTDARTQSVVFAYVLPALFLLAVYAMASTMLFPVYRLCRHGQVVRGKIVALDVSHMKQTNYRVRYSFTDARGGSHDADRLVTEDQYNSLNSGAPLDVTYLPDDPRLSRPRRVTEDELRARERDLSILALVFGVVMLGTALWQCRDLALHRFLAQYGSEASARVTRKWSVSGKGGMWYWVRYELTDADGVTYPKQYYVPHTYWNSLQVEGQLPVVYDPNRPRRSLPVAALRYRVEL